MRDYIVFCTYPESTIVIVVQTNSPRSARQLAFSYCRGTWGQEPMLLAVQFLAPSPRPTHIKTVQHFQSERTYTHATY